MNITKQQRNLLIGLALVVLGWLLFFRRKNTTEESSLADITDWKNIGNDFYIPNSNEKSMAKKWIDGTIQDGFLINDKNEYRGGETDPILISKQTLLSTKNTELTNLSNNAEMINLESTKSKIDGMGNQTNCSQSDRNSGKRSWIASNNQVWCDSQSTGIYNTASSQLNSWNTNKGNLKRDIGILQSEIDAFKGKEKSYIPVPTSIGIRKADGKGNYFYFEPLPEWKMNEIKELERLKAEAEEAERIATLKRQADLKRAAEQKRKQFELQKKQAEEKAAQERLQQQRLQQELAQKEKESADKKKQTIIIVVVSVVIIAIVGVLIWKKYKK